MIGYHYHTGVRYEYHSGLKQNLWKDENITSFIPVTVGINCFLTKTGIRPYIGLELGLLNIIEKQTTEHYWSATRPTFVSSYNNIDILLVPTVGVSVPITKSICVSANAKFQLHLDHIFSHTGINLGIAYSIP